MRSRSVIDLRGARPRGGSLFRPRRKERPSPLRTRKRRKRIAVLLGILILVVALGIGGHFALALPRLSVHIGTVEGVRVLSERAVRAQAESALYDGTYTYVPRASIFRYPKGEIEQALTSTFPRLKSAIVSRESLFATALIVRVEEREASARWCADEAHLRCYLVDREGFIFAQATSTDATATAYVFQGGVVGPEPIGTHFAAGKGARLFSVLDALSTNGLKPKGARTEEAGDVEILLEQGYFLLVPIDAEAEMLVRNVRLILDSDALRGKEEGLEYIDLRFGNRVYYRLKGDSEVQRAGE